MTNQFTKTLRQPRSVRQLSVAFTPARAVRGQFVPRMKDKTGREPGAQPLLGPSARARRASAA